MIARRSALLLLAAAVAAPGLAQAPAKPKAGPDWANTVAATPEGGIRIGNPAAKVRLVEFASYSCGHCKAFHEVGLPALKATYIAGGNVSFEQRSFVRNGPDFAASLLVACQPPRAALAFAGKLFADQEAWFGKFVALPPAELQALAALPEAQQPAAMAKKGGLDAWAVANGLPAARVQACLIDKAAQDRLLAIRKDALETYELKGTPAFGINGAPVPDVYDWTALEPKLQAALKSPKS
jgi:protein-disulfide isomerase